MNENVIICKNLLEQLNYFNGNVFLTGKLKGLQIYITNLTDSEIKTITIS